MQPWCPPNPLRIQCVTLSAATCSLSLATLLSHLQFLSFSARQTCSLSADKIQPSTCICIMNARKTLQKTPLLMQMPGWILVRVSRKSFFILMGIFYLPFAFTNVYKLFYKGPLNKNGKVAHKRLIKPNQICVI